MNTSEFIEIMDSGAEIIAAHNHLQNPEVGGVPAKYINDVEGRS